MMDASTGKNRAVLTFSRDLLVIVAIAIIASFMIKTFFVRSFFIPSGSMENTLLIDDHVLVNEIGMRFGGVSRGDVVVFKDPGGWLGDETPAAPPHSPIIGALQQLGLASESGAEYLVKRVIGMPGDRIECCDADGYLKVNGVSVAEPYTTVPAGAPASGTKFDVVVPDGFLWVMGDNRYNSADSRAHVDGPTHGFVPVDAVVGTAFAIIWPLNRLSLLSSDAPAGRATARPPAARPRTRRRPRGWHPESRGTW